MRETSSSLSLKQKCQGERIVQGDLKAGKVELQKFSSPHLEVEAGANNVIELSKPKRENFKKNTFHLGSSITL